jgi:hypothetical protein
MKLEDREAGDDAFILHGRKTIRQESANGSDRRVPSVEKDRTSALARLRFGPHPPPTPYCSHLNATNPAASGAHLVHPAEEGKAGIN